MKHSNTILLVALMTLGGCGQQLVDDGSGFLKTQSGEMASWPTDSKVVFESDESVPTDLRQHIYLGQEDINAQISRVQVNVQIQNSTAPKIRKSVDDVIGDGTNGIYFLPEPWPWAKTKGKENSDAMTVVINRGATLIEADIFYRISTYNSLDTTKEDSSISVGSATLPPDTGLSTFMLNTTYAVANLGHDERWTKVAFIHECLHALGFTHLTKEVDSIMYPWVSNLLYDSPFSTNDISRLHKLY